MRKKNFLRRVSLGLMLSFLASQIYGIPNVKADSDNTYPYNVSPDSTYGYLMPQTYYSHAILADEYMDTPAHKQTPGANDADGWAFHQTVMFPANYSGTDIPSVNHMKDGYNGSRTGEQAMESVGYGISTTDDTDSHYYLNWKFGDMINSTLEYNYSSLIYYREVDMYNDSVRVPYKVDPQSFQSTAAGATVWQAFPSYTSCTPGTDFVHDYHLSTVTAYPQHTKPTADFYFNSGDSTESVNPGQTVQVIDGNTTDTYDNTNSLYWSAYTSMANNTHTHGDSHPLPQSYAYDDAIIIGASWAIYDSDGNNVTSQFNTQLGQKDKEGATTNFSFTPDSTVTPGTYYVGHFVTDNWGSTLGRSPEVKKAFKVSAAPQSYTMTVHYIDTSNIYTDLVTPDPTSTTGQYTPTTTGLPSGYSLTGNYRTSITGPDMAYSGSIDMSPLTSNTDIYVMCSQSTPVSSSYTLNISYVAENDDNTTTPITTGLDGCDRLKTYEDGDSQLKSYGDSGRYTYYLPTQAPSGYDLDTSKYKNSNGYAIGFNVPADLAGANGISSTATVNLIVYCKSNGQPVNPNPPTPPTPVQETGTVIERYFLAGAEQTADEKEIDNVPVGTQTYNNDKSYPRYICSNPSVTVDVTANDTSYVDFNFGFQNHPPTVTLQGPSEVVMGDDFNVYASGQDPDGDPITYTWKTPTDFKGSTSDYTATGYFDSTGNKTFSVTATDPYNASGSDSTTIKVVPPIPNVVIDKSGTEKENRKITLDAEKYSSSGSKGRYPLDWSKAQWQFFDSSGNALTVDSNPTSSTLIKLLESTTGTKNMDLIVKKAGKYTAKCTLYNTAGYSNSFTVDLNIISDLAPTADFNLDSAVGYRNPKDLSPNGLAQGTTTSTDNSSSSDDNIGKRMWLACFDSDNDGSFINITNNEDGTKKATPDKERWYVFDLDYNGDSDTRYKIQVPDGTPLNGNLVTIGSDGHKYAYVNDSLNPHWRYVGSYEDVLKLDINKINCGNLTSVSFKTTSVGNVDMEEEVEESFGQETIPQLITNSDLKQANTFNDIH